MIKKISTTTFLLLLTLIFSQTKIKVLDEENKKPVPYAKLILKDKDYYKNTEENGEATLENDEEVLEIQSFGYLNLKVQNSKAIYLLKPKFTEIKEIKIALPKFENTLDIGEITHENFIFGGLKANWTVANYFPYDEKYSQTKFIKSIKFLTKIQKRKKGKIKLVFYKNENGKPSNEIWKSYIVECNAKKNITEYELEKPVKFPENGIFIGFEWINNKENIYQQKYYVEDSEKHITLLDYNVVSINAQKSENDEIWILGKIIWDTPEGKRLKTGHFKQESWLNYKDFLEKDNFDNETNRRLSIQLELTD